MSASPYTGVLVGVGWACACLDHRSHAAARRAQSVSTTLSVSGGGSYQHRVCQVLLTCNEQSLPICAVPAVRSEGARVSRTTT